MKIKKFFNIIIAIICVVLLFLIFIKTNDIQLMIEKEIEKIQNIQDEPAILLKNIKNHDHITSPLVVEGEAKGMWFSEGTFPVILTDGEGLIIAEGETTVKSDWVTENYVRFEVYLEFEKPEINKKNGHLIFQNVNLINTTNTDNVFEILVNFE